MTTSPRHRRLTADSQRLFEAFIGHPHVRVEPLGPAPAERFRICYDIPGLWLTPDNRVARTRQTVVEFYLGATYPREKPYVVALTPVFHPNFGAHVCIADHWAPSQSLVDIVVQVGQMLQWQIFNTQSPLNAVAARWAAENGHQLPVGSLNVQPLGDSYLQGPAPAAATMRPSEPVVAEPVVAEPVVAEPVVALPAQPTVPPSLTILPSF